MITWQWIVSQIFALIGLIYLCFSFQQKTSIRLILLRNIATLHVFTGLCFLGNLSAIIMCGAGIIRNAVSLYFSIKPETKNVIKYFLFSIISLLLVALNIIFWENYYNLFSIFIGLMLIYTFMQVNPAKIRVWSIISGVFAVVYFCLLFSPINIVIELVGVISAIVGIIRLDRNKNKDKSFDIIINCIKNK
ncbi:MAG: YgjV family protein [Clostridia bacterium]|nr:YgjV family protein [Clostridia bacterium]